MGVHHCKGRCVFSRRSVREHLGVVFSPTNLYVEPKISFGEAHKSPAELIKWYSKKQK